MSVRIHNLFAIKTFRYYSFLFVLQSLPDRIVFPKAKTPVNQIEAYNHKPRLNSPFLQIPALIVTFLCNSLTALIVTFLRKSTPLILVLLIW